ncbi:Methyltransferase-like protein 23 [Desmophyllum pertusum]|uniref:Methyltransferase-like protein 23 n=1 Tax=Desmophyllum pertusum TaxID=174260 RepID=A0A9W9YZZ7_9CNID|nr:Methyltransferase-like protein 23 [Desmophyllum pertusum]
MQVERIFSFEDECKGEKIQVRIPEIVDPQYGMFTWPAAPVLAQFIWHNREQVKGKQVIEIGAGTALPGLVASLCGANVTLTDKEEFPECLENCRRSCCANGQDSVKVVGITWGQFSPNLLKLTKADIILGSDCFYDTKDFDDILATVSFLMDKNHQAMFWTTYQERSSSRSIEDLLKKWGLKGVQIPLEDFNADHGNVGDSNISDLHTIQMLEITSQCQPQRS